jgi:hypothetical protein
VVTSGPFIESLNSGAVNFPLYAAAPWSALDEQSAFAQLGFEAGALIRAAAESASLRDGLQQATLESARGSLKMQVHSHSTRAAALHLHAVHEGRVSTLPAIAEAQVSQHLINQLYYTGFTNPYLTI